MKVGDTFMSPGGPNARFSARRKMKVVSATTLMGQEWIDAVPVEFKPRDRYAHSTYLLVNGKPQRV